MRRCPTRRRRAGRWSSARGPCGRARRSSAASASLSARRRSDRRTRGAPCTASGDACWRSWFRSRACRGHAAGRSARARRRRAIRRPTSRRSGRARRARRGGRRPWTRIRARRAPRRGPSSSCSRPACPRQDRVVCPARTDCSDTARRGPHGLGTTSSARRRRSASGCSASSPSTPLADIAENWPPGGHRGTQVSETEWFAGLRWGRTHSTNSA